MSCMWMMHHLYFYLSSRDYLNIFFIQGPCILPRRKNNILKINLGRHFYLKLVSNLNKWRNFSWGPRQPPT